MGVRLRPPSCTLLTSTFSLVTRPKRFSTFIMRRLVDEKTSLKRRKRRPKLRSVGELQTAPQAAPRNDRDETERILAKALLLLLRRSGALPQAPGRTRSKRLMRARTRAVASWSFILFGRTGRRRSTTRQSSIKSVLRRYVLSCCIAVSYLPTL